MTIENSDEIFDKSGRRTMSVESLIELLGKEAAEKIVYCWGGMRVSVPSSTELDKLRLRARVADAFLKGATSAQVAERFGISIRTAQRMRSCY